MTGGYVAKIEIEWDEETAYMDDATMEIFLKTLIEDSAFGECIKDVRVDVEYVGEFVSVYM